MHFVWNAVDVSMIVVFHAHSLCQNRYSVVRYSSKNYVRIKNEFRSIGSRLCVKNLAVILRDFHVVNVAFSSQGVLIG